QRLSDLIFSLRVETQVVVDLLIRIRVGQPGGIHESAQVGGAGRGAGDLVTQRRGDDRERSALRATGDRDSVRVDLGAAQQEIHRATGVDVEAPVAVTVPIGEVVGQQ